jgi:hypothetical protein
VSGQAAGERNVDNWAIKAVDRISMETGAEAIASRGGVFGAMETGYQRGKIQ